MTDVTNYWPDPQFRATTGDAPFVAANLFPNPSPTVDLTGWTAASGGSISRVSGGMFPGNTHKCQVTGGVTLRGANTSYPSQDWCFTGKIKANGAQTITISGAMEDTEQSFVVRTVGWGSFGWAEDLTYAAGDTKVFTDGEECLFRIYCGESTSVVGPDHRVLLTLTSTAGTFDLDGITQWLGVDDGAGDGDLDAIPNAFLYFSGDTPDDENFTYSWYGTAHDSTSLQIAKKAKYAYSTYDYVFSDSELPLVPELAFQNVQDDEHRLAIRSAIMFGNNYVKLYDGFIPDPEDLPMFAHVEDKVGFELPDGNYALTFDLVTEYQQYYYGFPEPEWSGGAYCYVQDISGDYPSRVSFQWIPARAGAHEVTVTIPFPVAGAKMQAEVDLDLNWVSGDVYLKNVGIFEIGDILHHYDGLDSNEECIWDMTALGVTAGKTYHSNVEMAWGNGQPIFEYKVGAGSWTTLVASTAPIAAEEKDMVFTEPFRFTVPEDATDVRLRFQDPSNGPESWQVQGINTFDLFEAPPDFFDGDTPDGGGYTYSWSGTPYESTSIRSEGSAGPQARVFVGGVAKTVSAMRVVEGGSLINITEAGA